MQALRTGIQVLRSASSSSLALSRCFDGTMPAISVTWRGDFLAERKSVLGFTTGARTLFQSAASITYLDKKEVTARVMYLLKNISFVDPKR
ncbi:uncharacterized protein LOC122068312 [Macadamia integrifolia]|uniref:uncharacterized protein LOC122068312 n=1 Tax=Macadamia integrifolia TaxID=60698 RepID=UPI001C502422|nr:uncharacterized protein LOC122068312 [Macadamia integrifolia]